jgi:hypothetical protein
MGITDAAFRAATDALDIRALIAHQRIEPPRDRIVADRIIDVSKPDSHDSTY